MELHWSILKLLFKYTDVFHLQKIEMQDGAVVLRRVFLCFSSKQ